MGENKPEARQGHWKQIFISTHFWANLLLIASGIVLYLLLSHLTAFGAVVQELYTAVSPFVIAFVIAWLLAPIVRFFQNKVFRRGKEKLRRALAVLVTYLLVLAVLTTILWVVLPQIYESLTLLIDKIPRYLEDLQQAAQKLANRFQLIDAAEADFLVEDYGSLLTKATKWLNAQLPQLINAGVIMGNGVVSGITALIASIYILVSAERLKKICRRVIYALLPAPQDTRLIRFLLRSNNIFTGFIDGKLLDSLIIGLICLAGCLLLQIPLAGLISLIVGVTNIIPVFGPIIGAVPCLIILLIVDPLRALFFLIFIVVLQQIDGNAIGPYILGDSTGVSPLGVLFSITVGSKLAGVTGMLVGVPLYAILSFTVSEYLDLRLARKAEAAVSAEAVTPAANAAAAAAAAAETAVSESDDAR